MKKLGVALTVCTLALVFAAPAWAQPEPTANVKEEAKKRLVTDIDG